MARLFVMFALVAWSLGGSPAAAQEAEHLPRRARPPAPGARPAGLVAYGGGMAPAARSDAERRFDSVVDGFLLLHFRLEPVRATEAGFHDYDAMLPSTDSVSIVTSIASLDSVRGVLATVAPESLGAERRADHAMLTRRLGERLDDLRAVETWKRDPGLYVAIASQGIGSLFASDVVPLEDRAWNVVARLTEIPRMLPHGKANLTRPSRAATERAVGEAAELVRFLGNRLPTLMAPVRDPVLREEFDHHLASAAGAAGSFYDWLRDVLVRRAPAAEVPESTGSAIEEGDAERVDSPLDRLLRSDSSWRRR